MPNHYTQVSVDVAKDVPFFIKSNLIRNLYARKRCYVSIAFAKRRPLTRSSSGDGKAG
jgi:hypothetical protein